MRQIVIRLKKIVDFDPNWAFPDFDSFQITDGFEMMHKAWRSTEGMPFCYFRSSIKFEGYMGKKSTILFPILSKITRPVTAIKSLRFALLYIERIVALMAATIRKRTFSR